MTFLEDSEFTPRPLNLNIQGLTPSGLFLGQGNHGLEVAAFTSNDRPAPGVLQQAFKDRKARRASPILIVVVHAMGVSLCGTSGDQPPTFHFTDVNQAERLCQSALRLPDRNAAIRFLADAMPSLETQLPGITNEGLLSLHELTHGTRNRRDWGPAVTQARSVLGKSKKELLTALGFTFKRLDNITELLSAGEERTALAVLLNEDEVPEVGAGRFNNLSPISYALTKADKERLPWVVMVQGDRVRLYNTKNIGVGRRGRTETYVECQPSLLSSDDIGLLWLLFSSDALKENGTINSILDESKRFAADIADRLRERIYEIVVPQLAMGIAKARNLTAPSKDDIALNYEMALTVLFRLLFIAYAEDRDLLPYKGNEAYRRRSLKQKAIELAKAASGHTPISEGDHHWVETAQLWQAVSRGNREWGVPTYDGTMFSSDANVSKAGAMLANISLPNTSFEEALRGLLLTDAEDTPYAPVDFRSLSVREFGTIYEGLLESELSIAEQNLTRDKKGTYLPAGEADHVFVKAGEIYLHDRSGARKSSGSYYTPDFAVEHLLDGALEPALDEHLERMKGLSDADRIEQFFDFRVADIAMGSGHFLVAAIDRIERRFALWLEDNPTPGITRELQYLREAAKNELGDLAHMVVIEDGQLLRRMIARRCIYGVDLNAITVQLARLSIWIHTFVPGLPLSLLDHNLVHGNALVGVGSLDEIREKFDEGSGTLFEVDADNLLGQAAEPLRKLAQLSDASVKDIEAGRALVEESRLKTLETKALCDLVTAQPVAKRSPNRKGNIKTEDNKNFPLFHFQFEKWDEIGKQELHTNPAVMEARETLKSLTPLHFPIAFPEVFLGRSQGFNVILGNPPWEKLISHEPTFWASKIPGLRGKRVNEQKIEIDRLRLSNKLDYAEYLEEEKTNEQSRNSIVKSGNYPGIGTGHPDLYKAFSWRFLALVGSTGFFGVALPRSILSVKGSEEFRRTLINGGKHLNICELKNKSGWVFSSVSEQYSFVLLSFQKQQNSKTRIHINGPFRDLETFRTKKAPVSISGAEIESWSESLNFPSLVGPRCLDVFIKLAKGIPLKSYKFQGKKAFVPRYEMDSAAQKPLMTFDDCADLIDFWPVYKGASFNVWAPDSGEFYAFAEMKAMNEFILAKMQRGARAASSNISELNGKLVSMADLPSFTPRIAIRDIARATDSKTLIACLIPPKTFVTENSPFLLNLTGKALPEAFVLGQLNSTILDWYMRRYVELHLRFHVLNPTPLIEFTPSIRNERIVEISAILSAVDARYDSWIKELKYKRQSLSPKIKEDLTQELDALVAHLFGLSEEDLVHIFQSLREGWNYEPRLNEVLKHYHGWAGKA